MKNLNISILGEIYKKIGKVCKKTSDGNRLTRFLFFQGLLDHSALNYILKTRYLRGCFLGHPDRSVFTSPIALKGSFSIAARALVHVFLSTDFGYGGVSPAQALFEI